jgi:hypothetical protein
MGKAIPSQHHPAVVLRSRYKIVRALLAIALIAIVGLMATVVILANDSEVVSTGEGVATPISDINYGGFNPATGRPESAPLSQEQALRNTGGIRHDGGPEDGTSGALSSGSTPDINYGGFNPATGRPESAPLPQEQALRNSGGIRYDGGPEEGTSGAGR